MFRNVPNMFVPMMWFNQKATVDDDLAGLLKLVVLLENSMMWITYTLASIAGALVLTLIISVFLHKKQQNKRKQDVVDISTKDRITS